MSSSPNTPAAEAAERWPRLARAVGLDPRAAVILAFSGGADSVLLLHWLCACEPRPPLIAVHVDHGLRGLESAGDASFCRQMCGELGVPFRLVRVALDPAAPSLEERARAARYTALLEEARRAHIGVIVTAHQADDSFETMLMRWMRGSDLAGLGGIEPVARREGARGPVRIVRPLLALRRAEVRRLADQAGLRWREDSSNHDARFTRTRIRETFLPRLAQVGGDTAVDNLRRFAEAIDALEHDLSARTADVEWKPLSSRHATRRRSDSSLGGTLRRAQLARLPTALRRRALWRLLVQGTARAPSRRLLSLLEQDLATGVCTRHALPGGWSLCLRSNAVELHPPLGALGSDSRQLWLPLRELAGLERLPQARANAWVERMEAPEQGFFLPVPGSLTLPDGRRLSAHITTGSPSRPIPRDARVVELDLGVLPTHLRVRWPGPGDRFHPLGSPGSRPLRRFLADARVPRGERRLVPIVWDAAQIVWVAGLRPSEVVCVRADSSVRLRLELFGGPGVERRAHETLDAARPPLVQGSLPFDGLAPGNAPGQDGDLPGPRG